MTKKIILKTIALALFIPLLAILSLFVWLLIKNPTLGTKTAVDCKEVVAIDDTQNERVIKLPTGTFYFNEQTEIEGKQYVIIECN